MVGTDETGKILHVSQLFWNREKFLEQTDAKGAKLKHKSTTLELIGVLLPFVQIPERLSNQQVVVKVDNIACFFGWQNLSVQGDNHASIIIRTLHLISSFLGCVVHLQHLPRMSTWDARLADRLSRETTTTQADKALLQKHSPKEIPNSLASWLENPTEDFALATRILEEVERKVKNNLS